MLGDSEQEGKRTTQGDGAGQRLSTPPPPPVIPSVPFPGWEHPDMMEHFQQHMKSIGFNDTGMLHQFVEHRNAMRNSSGEHVPFAGIKRKRAGKKKSSASKPKKTKTRSTKRRKKSHGDVEVKTQDGQEAAANSDSASGTLFLFFGQYIQYSRLHKISTCLYRRLMRRRGFFVQNGKFRQAIELAKRKARLVPPFKNEGRNRQSHS